MIVSPFVVLGLAVYQIYSLVKYVDLTNRELSRFLAAVGNSDFSQTFRKSKLGKSFAELEEAFNRVMNKFQATRKEKEENFRVLRAIVQHVGIGLILFDEPGGVELVNNEAKRLFGLPRIGNIQALNRVNAGLGDKLLSLKNERRQVLKIFREDELLQALAYSTVIKLRNKNYTLVALQNIQYELEEKEMETWQNLIKVLTHEIMNSITPISSLASTMRHILEKDSYSLNETDTIDDMKLAVKTIEKRSAGLIHFVENYRNLTQIHHPDFGIFPVFELFENVESFVSNQLKTAGIEFVCNVTPPTIELMADQSLIEQVIINLINNSVYWLKGIEQPKIRLDCFFSKSARVTITVTDNGAGIKEDELEKIFIPFYTSKPEGSGIGLSLCRQIMRVHNGSIFANSEPGVRTVFTLRF